MEEVGSSEPEPIHEYVDTEISQKEEKLGSEKFKKKKYKKPKRQASCLDIILDVKALVLASHDRSRRYGILLDRLHDCIILLILFLSAFTLVCVAIFGAFGTPKGYYISPPQYHLVDADMMDARTFIKHTFDGFSPHNGRFSFKMRMPYNSSMTGILQNDFSIEVSVRAKKAGSEDWVEVVRLHKNKRKMECVQDYLYSEQIYENEDKREDYIRRYDYSDGPACSVMTILYDNPTYKTYDVEVRIDPKEKILYDIGLINGYVMTWFSMNSIGYTTFEWVLRLIFSIISAFFFLFFSITMIRSQKFAVWSTQQKWICLLLLELVFYHDPLYVADVFSGWYVFPIIETILSMTFVFTFLLYLLIFFHSLFKHPQERTFFNFWMTKLLIILPMYVITMILFVSSRLYDHADPSHDDIRDVEFFYYLEVADTILFFIYVADLFYYFFKAIGNARRMRKHFSARFKIIGGLSFIVVVSFIGLTVSWGVFRFDSPGFQFLVSHTIILMYFGWLTIFFLPSTNIEENRPKVSQSKKHSKKKYQSLDDEIGDDQDGGVVVPAVVVDPVNTYNSGTNNNTRGGTGATIVDGRRANVVGSIPTELEFGSVNFDQIQRDNRTTSGNVVAQGSAGRTQKPNVGGGQRGRPGVDILEMGERNSFHLDEIQAEIPRAGDSGSIEMKDMKLSGDADDDGEVKRRKEEEERVEEEMENVFAEDQV